MAITSAVPSAIPAMIRRTGPCSSTSPRTLSETTTALSAQMPPAATASLAHALASQPETVSGEVIGPIAVWYQGVKMATTTTSALITVSTAGNSNERDLGIGLA